MSHDSTQRGIIAWFARNPVAANLLMVTFLVFGINIALDTRTETFPLPPPNFVTIDIANQAGAAKDNEEGITIKVEDAIQSLQGVKEISSTSTKNNVNITVTRVEDYDLDKLGKDIKNKVDSLAFPDSAEKPVITQATDEDDEEIIAIHVVGDVEHSILQATADRFRRQLLANPIIKKVDVESRLTPELNIEIDEQRLQAYGLSLSDVRQQINAASFSSLAGELTSSDRKTSIKIGEQYYHTSTFGAIDVLRTTGGQTIPLTEVATLKNSYANTDTLSRFNSKPSISLHLKIYGESDVLNIVEQVNTEIKNYQPQLPTGIELAVWNDTTLIIKDRLGLLAENALTGLAVVLVMLAFFLNLRVAFWVAVGVPVVFAGAMILINPVFNITINELSTFGFIMALGIVVDDAVVIGESVHASHLRYGHSVRSTILGAQRVSMPTIFGVLTSIVAFQAISMVKGEMGSAFATFTQVIVAALIFSIIESKFILPAHLAHAKDKAPHRWNIPARIWIKLQNKFSQGMSYFAKRIYRPMLYRLLSFRYAVLALAFVLMILVVGMLQSGRIGAVFFPEIPSDYITIKINHQDDVGYGLTHRQGILVEQSAKQVNQALREKGESHDVIKHIVTKGDRTSITISASLVDRSERKVTTHDVVALWRQHLPPLEAIKTLDFITNRLADPDIEIQLFSKDGETLKQAVAATLEKLNSIASVTSTDSNLKIGEAQITLNLTPQGKAMGLSVNDLASQVQLAYHGQTVQKFQRDTDEISVRLAYPESQRKSMADLGQTRIRTQEGHIIPLEVVASIHSEYVSDEINRKKGARVATVTGYVNENLADPADVVERLEQTFLVDLQKQLPNLRIDKGAEAAEREETIGSLKLVLIGALIGIYALLAIPLKSYFQPLVIMFSIPFGIVGALLGHWVYDLPVNLLSMFGIIALSGVVVNDSLLLVNRYNELYQSGMRHRKAIAEAAGQRFRAIILTSLTTFAGLLPLMSETSENAQFLIPAALSIAYGSLFATVITLLIIPNLLMIIQDFNINRWRKPQPRQMKLHMIEQH